MTIRDVPRPMAVCPECGETDDLFWHCAKQDDHGVYAWGTLVTCNKCRIPFSVEIVEPLVPFEGFGIWSDNYEVPFRFDL